MKRKLKIIIPIIVVILIIIFGTIPMFEMKTEKKFYAIRYTDSYDEFEKNGCYDESYYYNHKHDISLKNFNHKQFLFFNFFSFDYIEGNVCETEYQLEESYIKEFIEKAVITENNKRINVKRLIEGRTAIVGNTKYKGNNYETAIYYKLNNEEQVMYIFNQYGLTIIQVGNTDEGPKYIAYK